MDGTTRIGIACLSLVILWIVVYWATPAPQTTQDPPRVTYQQPIVDSSESPDADLAPSPPVEQPPQQDPVPVPLPEPERADDDEGSDDTASGARPGRIIPPSFVDYTVREGDNAWSISVSGA